jgi:two-component system, OmpR family, KDP operon response regulator KdpE
VLSRASEVVNEPSMTKAMHSVLVVEDDAATRFVLRALLEAEHFRCCEADTAASAETQARIGKPDLVLIDLGLPDGDGLQVIYRLRAWSPVPIIVISGSTQEDRKIAALDAGADDYVTKPFVAAELLARVRAGLRKNLRSHAPTSELILGDTRIDLLHRQTHGRLGDIHLTPMEYRVLECLARNLGFIVAQDQLIREVWGPQQLGDTRNLRVCMKTLREKLEPAPARPRYLINEMGIGYRLRANLGRSSCEAP